MAFRQPEPAPRQFYIPQSNHEDSISPPPPQRRHRLEESQEWILFSPCQTVSTTTGVRTDGTSYTAGLSHISDLGLLVARSGQPTQTNAGDVFTEDGELDSLDEGLHAFREPPIYRSSSNQGQGAILPAHDGLGTFPASSAAVQGQLWQHEEYNPERKYEGSPARGPSLQRRLDTIEELDLQISEDKRLRIERWRIEQSQALLDEVERETRRTERHPLITMDASGPANIDALAHDDLLEITPKQGVMSGAPQQETEEVEPFWRRVTRKFIRDVIGIDEPLLSVIVGETLPEDMREIADLVTGAERDASSDQPFHMQETWPDRLLHRIARELGLLVNKLSPHPGVFAATASHAPFDYAGIPISEHSLGKLHESQRQLNAFSSKFSPQFSPTMQQPSQYASWGLEDETSRQSDSAPAEADDAARLRREREYWERELDIKMVFRFLKSRFSPAPNLRIENTPRQPVVAKNSSTRRADVICQHHPLVGRAQHPAKRRNSSLRSLKRSASSCASESARSGHRSPLVRSASSRNYWDIGGSIGSSSAIASGGMMMGGWGEV